MPPPRPLAAPALLFCAVAAFAQPPKDAPKTAPAADEQKAKEAFLAGKLDDALVHLRAAAKANPAMSPPKVVAARWCVETGNGPQARLLIEQAATDDPAHPDVLLTNASFALAEGRVTDAVLGCTAALAATDSARWDADTKKKYQREARLGLAAAFEARGDSASVKTHLAALLDADPRNAALRQRLARTLFLVDKPDEAFAELGAAHKEDPTLDPPQMSMAQLWTAKHDFAKADEWYTKAVASHPNSAKVHRALAGYLLDRGRLDTARAHLAAAQKLEPASRDTKALAGLTARYAKDYAAATAVFEELVRDHPSFGFGVVNLALVLAESGDATGKRRATELAEGYAKQNPRAGEPRAVLAYCLFKAGRAADAEKVARTTAGGALSPDAAYFVARVLADRGATDDAQKILRAAAESKDGFVYRKDATDLLADLDKKNPPAPKK
jgi:tetratricopeptide (TPR) repeat protein